MKTILVTGGIASGKTEVCNYVASMGFDVYDSDSRTKALYASVPGLKEKAEEAIGCPLESAAAVVFSDPQALSRLESVVYPEVLADFMAWRNSRRGDVVFFESAVALEKEIFNHLWDEVWLVVAPLESRMKRNAKVRERIGAQRTVDPAEADIVIVNDSTIGELHEKIDRLIKTI